MLALSSVHAQTTRAGFVTTLGRDADDAYLAVAAKAGLLRDDIVIAMDDRNITNATNLIQIVGAKPAGAVVELRVLRNGKEQRIRVTLVQRPPPPANTRCP